MTNKKEISASIIIIGNEVLSGRTKDLNTSSLALWLNSLGITVGEVRVIPDIEQTIIDDENNYGKIINVENNSILAMLNIELAERKKNEQQKIKTNDGLVLEFNV